MTLRAAAIAVVLAALTALAGCGRKGDLYLPPPADTPADGQPADTAND